jgi:hypothetical protein
MADRNTVSANFRCIRLLGLLLMSYTVSLPALAQPAPQGTKLAGSDAIGKAQQGQSVAISGDGNTAIVGGAFDNSDVGAAWIYSRIDGVWSQQGHKLLGTGVIRTNAPLQGWMVAISADGNTAIVGAPGDNAEYGSVWIFTRSGGFWSQGGKLNNRSYFAGYGSSVAISGDGNTVLIGAIGGTDLCCSGAAFVFTRTGDVWEQQGDAFISADRIGPGVSVALSADGNTALVGDPGENGALGTAYVFTRTGGVWSQQGKLAGADALGAAQQGQSVAISADGNTAIVGGPADNDHAGAAWVFTRDSGGWDQQGIKIF